MLEKFVAKIVAKIAPSDTSRNNCFNKKRCENFCFRVCLSRQFFMQLVSHATELRDMLHETLPSVTAPLGGINGVVESVQRTPLNARSALSTW